MTEPTPGSAATDMSWSAVRPRWAPRRWLVTLTVAAAIAVSVIVFSSAPWWTAILGVCLPAALYGTEAQRNMEWAGYQRCPTCKGSGKVPDDA